MDIVEKFFKKKLITNENTKRNYKQGIKHFFDTLQKEPDTYFNNKHDIEKDIGDYYLLLKKQNYAPWTIKLKINSIKQFLSAFDRDIKTYEIWETISLRLRGSDKVTEETPLDKNDIKKILNYGDLCAKAMFTIMASSGCRIESIVGLKPGDIHTEENPTRIVFRPEIVKGKKNSITSFITDEATEYLKLWLEKRKIIDEKGKEIEMSLRDQYLKSAAARSTFHEKTMKDDRVFPMTDVNARLIWKGMVTKAGYDKRNRKSQRLFAHTHSLRKFFRSWLGNADLSETLLGHKGYLSTYKQYNYKQLGQEYLKYMHNVTIGEGTVDTERINSLQNQITDKDQKIQQLEERVKLLELYKQGLENKLDNQKLRKDIEEIKNGKK